MSDDRQPPFDLAAEMGVIGSMMLSGDVLAEMSTRLQPDDFYRPVHGALFATMVGMFTDGVDVGLLTLMSRLHEIGELERVGGAPYLHTVSTHAMIGSAGDYARSVIDRAIDRGIVEHAALTARVAATPGSTRDRVDMVQASADTLGGRHLVAEGAWAGDLLSGALDAIEAAGRGDLGGLITPTGFADLDRLLGGGLRAGQLAVVAGRPGLGKSTAAMDFCRHASIRCDTTSAIISLEMTEAEIMQRLLSAESRVPLAMIRSGDLRNDELQKIIDQVQPITDAPLRIIATAEMSLARVRAEARRLKRQFGLRRLIIDHVGLFVTPPGADRREFISDLSRGFKLLAFELMIEVVMVSQLNRGPEQRADKRPQLSDLRESGAIEQDADIVILLHRDDYYDKESARAGEADFIVAKHRGGPTDTITVASQLHLSRFVDMAIV